MKAMKIFTCVLMMINLIFLSSCSDSITSLNSAYEDNQSLSSDSKRNGDSFLSKVIIKPGDYAFLYIGNTGLSSISDYSISDCESAYRDLYISASNIDASQSLPCSSSEYLLDDLLIENKSGQIKTVEVNLFGIGGNKLTSLSHETVNGPVAEKLNSKTKSFSTTFMMDPGETRIFDSQTISIDSFNSIKIRNMTIHDKDTCDRISYILMEIPGPSGYYEACLQHYEEVKENGLNYNSLEIKNLSESILKLDVYISQ